ncbi:MAG: ribose 5-phosphate isomerase B [Oscillospiraceae bacterium]|nr:ribose 5-phosphate isomerase B [Oscillospiraceae bacterium]
MIAIGSDHGGYALKEQIKKHLDELGLAYRDYGTDSEASCDYPIYGEAVARAVAGGEAERGIVICGTGIGISISANKVKGIRAALCGDCYSAEYTRRHNDANVLALGARVLGEGLAEKIVDTFLSTDFEGGRHARRVALIAALEERERQ